MTLKKILLLLIFCFIIFNISKAQMSYIDLSKPDNSHLYEHNDYNMFKKRIRYQQDTMDNRGIMFGLNLGMFQGNSYNANYFSGADGNENNLRYILSNPYNYNAIYAQINNHNYDSTKVEAPTSMSYSISFMLGFFARYNFKRNLGIFVQVNYVKLTTSSMFALSIDSVNFTSQPSLRFFPIVGVEQRTYIDFGLQKQIPIGDKTNFYYEGGLNINSTSVKSSQIQIGTLNYSLVNNLLNQSYIPNTQQTTYNVYQGGIGFGIFGGAGISLIFNSFFSVDPGFDIYYQKIGLDGYPDYKLNYYIYVRLMMRNLF